MSQWPYLQVSQICHDDGVHNVGVCLRAQCKLETPRGIAGVDFEAVALEEERFQLKLGVNTPFNVFEFDVVKVVNGFHRPCQSPGVVAQ